MKREQNSRIKILAEKIIEAEKEIELGNNIKKNEDEIYNIMSHLSVEDMLKIDMYIQKNNMLTK